MCAHLGTRVHRRRLENRGRQRPQSLADLSVSERTFCAAAVFHGPGHSQAPGRRVRKVSTTHAGQGRRGGRTVTRARTPGPCAGSRPGRPLRAVCVCSGPGLLLFWVTVVTGVPPVRPGPQQGEGTRLASGKAAIVSPGGTRSGLRGSWPHDGSGLWGGSVGRTEGREGGDGGHAGRPQRPPHRRGLTASGSRVVPRAVPCVSAGTWMSRNI